MEKNPKQINPDCGVSLRVASMYLEHFSEKIQENGSWKMEIDRTECEQDLEECIQYFRQRPVYHKLFAKVRDKYRSLGHFGGAVQLSGLTPE